MLFKINFTEVAFLSIFFTALALYFDIYGEKHVLSFIINHVIELLCALGLSKIIHTILVKHKIM